MKKFLLFAAAALTAGIAMAQDAPEADGGYLAAKNRPADYMLDKNYVVNGGFEDQNYVSSPNTYWYPWDVEEATEVPNWYLATSGCWNGVIQILPQSVDEYVGITEDNKLYLDILHYDRNGWTKIRAINTVTGLTPGKEYTLDMYVASSYDGAEDWSNPDNGFSIYGKDPSGALSHDVDVTEEVEDEAGNKTTVVVGTKSTPLTGALLYANSSVSEEPDWEYHKYTFTPTEDVVFIEFWSQLIHGEDGDYLSGRCYFDIDEVRVYDASMVDPDAPDSIESIDNENTPVEYFTLQGVRMPAGAALHGTFIAKQGKKASKVYIR